MAKPLLKMFLLIGVFFAVAGASAYLTLTLVIESEESVVVPSLERKNAIAVLELLSDLGLNTRVIESQYHPDVAEHHVIYQEPQAGSRIKKGRDVKVVLSKGQEVIAVPNLAGITLRKAEVILKNNGLALGRISRARHQSKKADTVVAQDPPAGASLTRQEPVSLLVSSGTHAEGYMMPDLHHLGLEKALSILENLGLSVGRIDARHDPASRPNIVVEQMPLNGYYVGPGQRVDLTVNRSSAMARGSSRAEEAKVLFRYRVPPGVLKQHIRLELSAFGTTSTIYDQLMKPGREIWAVVPRYTEAALFLYKNDELTQTEVYNTWKN